MLLAIKKALQRVLKKNNDKIRNHIQTVRLNQITADGNSSTPVITHMS